MTENIPEQTPPEEEPPKKEENVQANEPAEGTPETEQTPATPPKKSKTKLIIGGIIALVAIVGAIYLFRGVGQEGLGQFTRYLSPTPTNTITTTPVDGTLLTVATTESEKDPLEVICSANPDSIEIGGLATWKVETKNAPEGSQIDYTWSGNYKDADTTTAIADYTYIYNKEGTYRAKVEGKAGREVTSGTCELKVAPGVDGSDGGERIACKASPDTIKAGELAEWTLDDSSIPADAKVSYTWSGTYDNPKNTKAVNDYTFIYYIDGKYTAKITGTVDGQGVSTQCALKVIPLTGEKEAPKVVARVAPTKPTEPEALVSDEIETTYEEPLTATIETTYEEPLTATIEAPYEEPLTATIEAPYEEPSTATIETTYKEPLTTPTKVPYEEPLTATIEAPAPIEIADIYCSGFKDVPATDNDCKAITYIKANKIMTGTEDGTNFNPEGELNRAEIAKISALLANSDIKTCTAQPFPDIELDAWYAPYVCLAKDNGIIKGYTSGEFAGQYGPSNPVNRAELLAIVLRTLDIETPDNLDLDNPDAKITPVYLDVNNTDWFSGYAAKSLEYTFFEGNYLSPAKAATRREAAQIMYKISLIENIE